MKTFEIAKLLPVYAERMINGDVCIYRDKEKTQAFCTFDRHRSQRPDRRYKTVMLNCYRWRLEWLN